MKNKIVLFLATGAYSGKFPKAPGTAGTLVAVPLWFLLSFYTEPLVYMALTVLAVVGAMFVCQLYEKNVQTHDSSEIVIDEIVGFLIAMTWVPLNWKFGLLGFLLFRLFDIWKPYPISYFDKNIKGGVGVVVDDVAAGILTNFILQVVYSYGLLG